MNDLTAYQQYAQKMRPGDVIAFGGTAVISALIDLFSGSGVSHVAMVQSVSSAEVLITESTIEGGVSGPQTHSLRQTLLTYGDGSRAWWLPLSDDARAAIDWQKFFAVIAETEDGSMQYDTPGLFGFLVRSLPILGPRLCQSENAKRVFCSGDDTLIFEKCGLLRGINYSQVTPQQLCEMKLYRECVQIMGKAKAIARFNTV